MSVCQSPANQECTRSIRSDYKLNQHTIRNYRKTKQRDELRQKEGEEAEEKYLFFSLDHCYLLINNILTFSIYGSVIRHLSSIVLLLIRQRYPSGMMGEEANVFCSSLRLCIYLSESNINNSWLKFSTEMIDYSSWVKHKKKKKKIEEKICSFLFLSLTTNDLHTYWTTDTVFDRTISSSIDWLSSINDLLLLFVAHLRFIEKKSIDDDDHHHRSRRRTTKDEDEDEDEHDGEGKTEKNKKKNVSLDPSSTSTTTTTHKGKLRSRMFINNLQTSYTWRTCAVGIDHR